MEDINDVPFFVTSSDAWTNRHELKHEIKEQPVTHFNSSYLLNHAPIQQATPISIDEVNIVVEVQPPVEVRTRTPNEIRTFVVSAKITGNYKKAGATIMKASLQYAPNGKSEMEPVKKDILGGTKTLAINPSGTAAFDNLTISESSTKNKEREFLIQLALIRNDGQELMKVFSKPFYAYSHKKVLQRRGSVQLRTLSKTWGRLSGGEMMHVIGTPFIQGPALAIIFRTCQGDIITKPTEFFSDSVLFFELPELPIPASTTPDAEYKVTVLVTNDGRTFSNSLDFTYISDATLLRSRF